MATNQGNRLRKGTYAHIAPTDILGVTMDNSTVPVPRPTVASTSDNGFVDITGSTISYVDGTRTFTIAPTGDAYYFYTHSIQYKKTASESVIWDDTEGLHVVYFDESGDLTSTASPSYTTLYDIIVNHAIVAIIYWDATNSEAILVSEERHGRMDGQTHIYLHTVFGAQWVSGLALGGMTVDGNGSSDTHVQFSVSDGSIRDEDLLHSIADGTPQDLSPIAYVPVYYMDGANGYWRKVDATAYPLTTSGGIPVWNEWTGSTWQLTNVTNTDYFLMHYFATPDLNNPIIGIIGQNEYGNKSEAQEGATTELSSLYYSEMAGLNPEFVPIATVIFQYRSSYSNSVKAIAVSTDEGADYIDWRNQRIGTAGESVSYTNYFDYIDFDTSPTAANQEARLIWNDDDGTLNLGLPGGNVVLQVGLETLLKVVNKTGAQIDDGTIVYITGSQGNKPTVGISSNTDATTLHITGVATEDIANNGNGYITLQGTVRDLDTTGTPVGETWNEGDFLYLDGNGTFTNVYPSDPTKGVIRVAVVSNVHATEGEITIGVVDYQTVGDDYDGALRYSVINDSTGTDAISSFSVVNDQGYRGSINLTGSGNTSVIGANSFGLYNEGYGDSQFVNDGDVSFTWHSDPTDSHDYSALSNTIMTLESDGDLVLTGDIILDEGNISYNTTRKISEYGGSFGLSSYFTEGEYLEIVSITPDSPSQNYALEGTVVASVGLNTCMFDFSLLVRSNTLPNLVFDLIWSKRHSYGINTSLSDLTLELWAEETTNGVVKLILKNNTGSGLSIHNASYRFTAHTRGTYSDFIDVSRNTEITSVDSGYTVYTYDEAYELASPSRNTLYTTETLNTFDAPGGTGSETSTTAAFAFARGHNIAGYVNGYIRNLFQWNTDNSIDIGAPGTTLIDDINLYPGSSGNVIAHLDENTELLVQNSSDTDVFSVSSDGDVVITNDLTAAKLISSDANYQAPTVSDYPTYRDTNGSIYTMTWEELQQKMNTDHLFAMCQFSASNPPTLYANYYNVDSITRVTTGRYRVYFETESSASSAFVIFADLPFEYNIWAEINSRNVAYVEINIRDNAGTYYDGKTVLLSVISTNNFLE